MAILFPGADSAESIIDCANRLATDIERLVADGSPSAADLSSAPVLDHWRPAPRILTCLAGMVTGHPIVRDGRMMLTSQLFAIDEEARWARSWSRLYSLRSPGDPPTWRRQ